MAEAIQKINHATATLRQDIFQVSNARGIPAGVGSRNTGKTCTVIIGHKEIEGLQKVWSFRDLEEFAGSSVEICPEDMVFSCQVDSVGTPYSVGIPNKECGSVPKVL